MNYKVNHTLKPREIRAWAAAHGGDWIQVGDYLAEVLHQSGQDYLLGDFIDAKHVKTFVNNRKMTVAV